MPRKTKAQMADEIRQEAKEPLLDRDQMLLDFEELRDWQARVRAALETREKLADEVRLLSIQLQGRKRLLKEASQNLGHLMGRSRR